MVLLQLKERDRPPIKTHIPDSCPYGSGLLLSLIIISWVASSITNGEEGRNNMHTSHACQHPIIFQCTPLLFQGLAWPYRAWARVKLANKFIFIFSQLKLEILSMAFWFMKICCDDSYTETMGTVEMLLYLFFSIIKPSLPGSVLFRVMSVQWKGFHRAHDAEC